jgi:hypothetical protein
MYDSEGRARVAADFGCDPDHVSKAALMEAYFRQGRELRRIIDAQHSALSAANKAIDGLKLELFCADPWHFFFQDVDEKYLVPMSLERIRRFS